MLLNLIYRISILSLAKTKLYERKLLRGERACQRCKRLPDSEDFASKDVFCTSLHLRIGQDRCASVVGIDLVLAYMEASRRRDAQGFPEFDFFERLLWLQACDEAMQPSYRLEHSSEIVTSLQRRCPYK